MRQIYLGSEDRYPRWLYWLLLMVFLADFAWTLHSFLTLLGATGRQMLPEPYLYSRAIKADVLNLAVTIAAVICTIGGYPKALVLYAAMQIGILISLTGQTIGHAVIGDQINTPRIVLLIFFRICALTCAIGYLIVRIRQDLECARQDQESAEDLLGQ